MNSNSVTLMLLSSSTAGSMARSLVARRSRDLVFFKAPNECGDFCGDSAFILVHFNTSQFNSVQKSKLLKQRALQGFLPSFQRVSKFCEKGFLNRGSGVRIPPGLPASSCLFKYIRRYALEPDASKSLACSEIVVR